MAQSVYFNGELITIPGAYSTVDTSLMSTKGDNTASKIVAILGEAGGGEPGAVQFLSDPVSAKKVLKSGELLKACEKAWDPVTSTKEGLRLGGANTIACIRTNEATKSTFVLKVGEQPQMSFSSDDWGEDTRHRLRMTDGSLSRTKNLIINDQIENTYETFENIGNLFTMAYTGEQPYATVTVSKNSNLMMELVTKIGADEATAIEDIKIVLDTRSIKSIKSLIELIQSYENYEVDFIQPYNPRISVDKLDPVSNQSIKRVAEQVDYRVTAVFEDLSDKLLLDSRLVSVDSYDNSLGELQNFDWTTMEGGTRGSSPASWVKYFDSLSNFDIFYIVPLTSDQIIHAELVAHIEALSGSLGRERRAIVGGAISETVDATLKRAREIAYSRVQVVHGGFYDYNSSNVLELYPPYMLAASHAGRAAFLDDGESATYDTYKMSSPEYKLERGEISQLLAGGCLAFEFVLGSAAGSQSFVRLVHDLTTDTISENSVYTERSTGALADSLNKELRTSLDKLITGKRTAVADLTSAKNRVISILSNRKLKGQIVDYKDVYVTKSGTVTTVDYSVAPAEPNNFTLITAHFYSQDLTV